MVEELDMVLEKARNISDEVWQRRIVRSDRYAHHFTETQIAEMIEKSENLGIKKGRELLQKFGNLNTAIEALEVSVEIVEEEAFFMPRVVNFGQYYDKKIWVSETFLKSVELYKERMEALFGKFSAFDVVVAHELFHHLEEIDTELKESLFTIEIKPVAFLKRTISPDCVGEIAAFAFAKEVTGIGFYPSILEMIHLWDKNKNYVSNMIEALCREMNEGGKVERT